MEYIQGTNKYQIELSPISLDDYIGEGSIVRLIEAFVNTLDMSQLGFLKSKLNKTGRPPFDPRMLLKLYIYGYLNRVRSSRRLHAETERNIEVMWLMDRLSPDARTICYFRKDNAKAIKKVYREFSKLCCKLELYGKELIAIDGTKVRANSSRHNIYTEEKVKKALIGLDEKIEKYMNKLNENDTEDSLDPRYTAKDITEIIESLSKKKRKLEDTLNHINENDGKAVSSVDTDARIMKQSGEGRSHDACYNVQTAVDSKHKLIPDFKISTCSNDVGELSELTENVKEIMETNEIDVTADKGYYSADDIAQCEKNGTSCYLPKVGDNNHAPDRNYDKKHFKYDKESDCYICPEGKILSTKQAIHEQAGVVCGYAYGNKKACKTCAKRDLCTKNKRGNRTVRRSLNQDALDIVDERMRTRYGRLKLNQRREMVEHPFGTVKKIWGYNQYLCRGVEMVEAEQSLAFLAYNFRRVINIYKQKGEDLLAVLATCALFFIFGKQKSRPVWTRFRYFPGGSLVGVFSQSEGVTVAI